MLLSKRGNLRFLLGLDRISGRIPDIETIRPDMLHNLLYSTKKFPIKINDLNFLFLKLEDFDFFEEIFFGLSNILPRKSAGYPESGSILIFSYPLSFYSLL